MKKLFKENKLTAMAHRGTEFTEVFLCVSAAL